MSRREAFGAYYFSVQINGLGPCFFRSVSGLKSESEVQEVAEGGVNDTTHKWIGRTKFPNIVLKQGFSDAALWDFRRRFVKDGGISRFSGEITQLGPNKTKKVWKFVEGWVCKWEGPDFDASKNEISVESIEIAHEGLISLK